MAQRRQQPTKRTRFIETDAASGSGSKPPARATAATRVPGGGGSARAATATRRTAAQAPGAAQKPAWYRPTVGKVVLMALLLAVVVFAANLCSSATPINVTVNGTQYALRGEKTLAVALKESGLPVNPGDLISLQGNVLERSAGNPFFATVNDEETADPAYKLRNGDVVTLSDGKDLVEPYEAVEGTVPYGASIVGSGPLHVFTPGVDGVMETRTGQISGEVVEKQTVDPVDLLETRSAPDVGERKVVALTFDDGPSTLYTQDILDILEQNGAKATFFCRGDQIVGDGADLVRKEAAAGHQVCTHSFDNGYAVGGEMSALTADQLVEQLEQGLTMIENALGSEEEPYEASRVVRMGSQDLTEAGILALSGMVDAEVGWSLDTGDWVYMTENDIYDVLMSVKPGDVVRMHDGGDHQDVTAAALKRALPKLAKKGYSFVTIDELAGWAVAEEGQG